MQAIPTEEQPLSMAQPQQIPSRPKRKRSDRLPHQSISQLIRNTKDWEVLETSAEGRTVKRSRGLGTKKKSGLFASSIPTALLGYIPGIIVQASPKIIWTPLRLRIYEAKLDLDSLLQMKRELVDYVRLLYAKGIEYKVKPDWLFPLRKLSGGWLLFLGGWAETNFCSIPDRIQSAEWKAQETEQLDGVERMFTELRARLDERDKAIASKAQSAAHESKQRPRSHPKRNAKCNDVAKHNDKDEKTV
ncbi:hypothetical protein CBS147339_9144 [Penicillium roqueforti]|nr:hypothetical protein CBS147339_9144 [Penicillium roqueforti]KAI3093099.1 hypothetical protein CBS147338_7255 [Penicillium roqueforti]KAI3128609.1 hypothetical protein CBS147326_6634 [Penicillium roqueforti]KAI3134987.1 hypothetical protein CBS147325_7940 [Penicillium roqueforti]KAI3155465.1 hypothetical protein DTO046C5_8123 [Penicillium roqueforti]